MLEVCFIIWIWVISDGRKKGAGYCVTQSFQNLVALTAAMKTLQVNITNCFMSSNYTFFLLDILLDHSNSFHHSIWNADIYLSFSFMTNPIMNLVEPVHLLVAYFFPCGSRAQNSLYSSSIFSCWLPDFTVQLMPHLLGIRIGRPKVKSIEWNSDLRVGEATFCLWPFVSFSSEPNAIMRENAEKCE